MTPISLKDLEAATSGRLTASGDAATAVRGVSLDSRTLRTGEAFFAVRGPRHDGHAFIGDAIARGAAACVVDERPETPLECPTIVVDNTVGALADLARWHRERHAAAVVALTGSVGKTTTRELLYAVLSERFTGLRNPRNYNNHLGLPLSVLALSHEHEFAVYELGSSFPGEIGRLADICRPRVGLITEIAPAHLEGFRSLAGIAAEKVRLLESLPPDGLAVLPGDNPHTAAMRRSARCETVLVGEGPHNDVRATRWSFENGTLTVAVDGRCYELRQAAPHFVTALLACLAVARRFGLSDDEFARGLQSFQPVPGRCEIRQIGLWTVIDDTYNASPRSMSAACTLLAQWKTQSRKVLIVGDMLELGTSSHTYHQQAGQYAAHAGVDRILAVGDFAQDFVAGAATGGMKPERLTPYHTVEELISTLPRELESDDVILVKGSRGLALERVIHELHDHIQSKHPQRRAG